MSNVKDIVRIIIVRGTTTVAYFFVSVFFVSLCAR